MGIYKEEVFENVCEKCSKTFETTDSYATLCNECWEKCVLNNLDEEGKG